MHERPELLVRILHPDDRETTIDAYRQAFAARKPISIRYRLIAKDGRAVWVHDELAIATDRAGRPTHAQGFLVDVTPQTTAQEELERQHAELGALHETALPSTSSTPKLLERIAVQAGELVGTRDTYVYLREDDALSIAVGTGSFAESVGTRVTKGEGLAGRVWATSEPLAVDDYAAGRPPARFEADRLHGVVGVPLRSRTDVVGVLGLAYDRPGKTFGASEIALLSRFAHLATLALESASVQRGAGGAAGAPARGGRAARGGAPLPHAGRAPSAGDLHQPQTRPWGTSTSARRSRPCSATRPTSGSRGRPPERCRAPGRPRRSPRGRRTPPRDWGAPPLRVSLHRSRRSDRLGAGRDDPRAGRGGGHLWVQGFLVDITERKLAEETRARLAAIVESSSDAITSASLDLRLTSWNAGAERMFGRPADEMVGQQITTVIPEGQQEDAVGLLGEVVARDHVALLETVRETLMDACSTSRSRSRPSMLRPEGRRRLGDRTRRHGAQAGRGRPRAPAEQEARAFAEDAQRDLFAQNERLRELDRLKDEFIALVSHELRTPLTSIRGYTELLLDEEAGTLTDDQRKFLGVVETRTDSSTSSAISSSSHRSRPENSCSRSESSISARSPPRASRRRARKPRRRRSPSRSPPAPRCPHQDRANRTASRQPRLERRQVHSPREDASTYGCAPDRVRRSSRYVTAAWAFRPKSRSSSSSASSARARQPSRQSRDRARLGHLQGDRGGARRPDHGRERGESGNDVPGSRCRFTPTPSSQSAPRLRDRRLRPVSVAEPTDGLDHRTVCAAPSSLRRR